MSAAIPIPDEISAGSRMNASVCFAQRTRRAGMKRTKIDPYTILPVTEEEFMRISLFREQQIRLTEDDRR